MTTELFELIDATGGGGCQLRGDGTIEAASPGFLSLTGAPAQVAGERVASLLAELPALDQLPEVIEAETPVFRQVGADGIGRELAAAYVRGRATLLIVDRSGEARLRCAVSANPSRSATSPTEAPADKLARAASSRRWRW